MKTQTTTSLKLRNIAIFCMLGFLVGGCSYVNKWCGLKDDNIVEEVTEKAIEMKTGLDIDLTPSTPENMA